MSRSGEKGDGGEFTNFNLGGTKRLTQAQRIRLAIGLIAGTAALVLIGYLRGGLIGTLIAGWFSLVLLCLVWLLYAHGTLLEVYRRTANAASEPPRADSETLRHVERAIFAFKIYAVGLFVYSLTLNPVIAANGFARPAIDWLSQYWPVFLGLFRSEYWPQSANLLLVAWPATIIISIWIFVVVRKICTQQIASDQFANSRPLLLKIALTSIVPLSTLIVLLAFAPGAPYPDPTSRREQMVAIAFVCMTFSFATLTMSVGGLIRRVKADGSVDV